MTPTSPAWRRPRPAQILRLVGLILLAGLLVRLDLRRLMQILLAADLRLVSISMLAVLPLMLIKAARWRGILHSQAIELRLGSAFSAYLSSLFVGSITFLAAGELVKVMTLTGGGRTTPPKAVASVLADRLFDLYTLLIIGGAGVLALLTDRLGQIELAIAVIALVGPLVVVSHDASFAMVQRFGDRLGQPGRRLFGHDSYLTEIRASFRQLRWRRVIVSVGLTAVSYVVFFAQCYLLAFAIGLRVGIVPLSFAVALANLVTMLPISISGLGTREATLVSYLATAGVPSEAALGFSVLMFLTFHVAGGLMGAVSWWLRPVPVRAA